MIICAVVFSWFYYNIEDGNKSGDDSSTASTATYCNSDNSKDNDNSNN